MEKFISKPSKMEFFVSLCFLIVIAFASIWFGFGFDFYHYLRQPSGAADPGITCEVVSVSAAQTEFGSIPFANARITNTSDTDYDLVKVQYGVRGIWEET